MTTTTATTTKVAMTRTPGITDWDASFSLAKAIMGAGSFALPWAFSKMGYIAGPIFLTLFLFLSIHSIGLLVECSSCLRRQQQHAQKRSDVETTTAPPTTTATATAAPTSTSCMMITYVDIARSTFGRTGAIVTYIASISASIGVCGSYLVFIAANLESLISSFILQQQQQQEITNEEVDSVLSLVNNGDELLLLEEEKRSLTILLIWTVALPLVVLLSSVRNPKRFAAVSFWGDVSVLAGMVTVVLYGMIAAYTNKNDYDTTDNNGTTNKGCVAIGSLNDMALAFGSIGYLFLVHFLVLPIESSMQVAVDVDVDVDVDNDDDDVNDYNDDDNNNDATPTPTPTPSNHRFKNVAKRTFTVCGCIGGLFGIIGYLLFGSETEQIVLMNVKDGGIGMATVQLLLCIDLVLTYPVVMRPSIEILEQQLLRYHNRQNSHGHGVSRRQQQQQQQHQRQRHQRQNNTTSISSTVAATRASMPLLSSLSSSSSSSSHSYQRPNFDNINENQTIRNNNDNDNDNEDEDEDIDNENTVDFVGWTTHIIVCIVLGVIAASAGSFIPAFGLLSGLVGGVSQTFLAFVLPPLMWSKQRYTHHTRDGSSSSSSSSSNAGDIWYCFLKLPRKEKMFVVGGFGLILWTLHSTWIGIQSGNE